jgi:VWFA-related protein
VSDARGRPLETLKASDFEVREDGDVRALDEAPFVRDDARLFAIYLDEYHVSGGAASERIRAALTAFIDRAIGAGDRLVVLKPLDSLLKIQFTTDTAAARRLVAAFEGRKGDYAPRTSYERELMAGTPARLEGARAQVVWSGLDALALHLGQHAGRRKTLILAAEPFVAPARRRGQESLPSLESAIRAANRANVAVYSLDPSDAPSGDANAEQPLQRLATETNGRLVRGDLEAGLRLADADARGYYMLTYRSHRADGGARYAGGLPGADDSRARQAEDRPRRGAHGDPRVHPQRPARRPCARLRSRRHGAEAERPSAEPRGPGDERARLVRRAARRRAADRAPGRAAAGRRVRPRDQDDRRRR